VINGPISTDGIIQGTNIDSVKSLAAMLASDPLPTHIELVDTKVR
jgi:hypothetical protein